MAALLGFDTWDESEVVSTPITLGATLLTLALPAGTCVAGFDMEVSDLDTHATPLIALNIGDANDADRFVAADETAQDDTGLLEYRPLNTAWYRYTDAASVLIKVAVAPATGASGAIALTLYGYPSVDISRVVRQTLQGMGVLSEAETARAEDAALAIEAINEIHEGLRFKRLAHRQDMIWTTAAIPVFAARPYAMLAGNLLADTFGLSGQRAARLAQRAAAAEREMRALTYTRSSGDPVNHDPYAEADTAALNTGVLA